jgi:DnaJ-class molecular chaperone
MKSSTDWIDCPECSGTGEQEYESNVPVGFDNPYGYVDTYMDDCTNCAGMGEIEPDELDDEL